MNHRQLDGKVAIVTGAARGIGSAIARRYAAEGACVVVADIDEPAAKETAESIGASGATAVAVGTDVGVSTSVDTLFEVTLDEFGTVDVLVNNAAVMGPSRHFLDTDEQWWDRYLTTNLKSHYLCVRHAAPIMARKRSGSIINVSSGGATRSHRGMIAYDASKGGIEAVTRGLALELGPYGVRVNTLVPGLIATGQDETTESLRRRDETIPLGRGGVAEDLAGPAVFLASEDARYVTGTRLVVDGGVLVQQRSPQIETFPVSAFPEVPQDDSTTTG
ncbi:SDR family NAD(P)-dependent oxidoreductase [Kibdelosporangium persicum]|uniref:Beta-ketoacyl-ACP reductase n=1 Tax=Kibdelosporangium persicum TaxID=2698649 RepID=A0ABX2FI96_9PSEU|nr:SDR family oxidoreductase [Kibdelosporangium persicum]NRN71138.1 Beta-ketoacyl-ACP reductase [Kibdelosporangium persicum]